MIVDLSNPVEYKAEEKRQRDAVLKIENWWIRRRNKKIFLLLKEGICAAERTLSYQVLRKISPTEADLLNDPALATRVRFRFGGDDYPPRILFKIFTNIKSCGNSIHYLSGKKYIKPGSQAAIDAGKQMGNRRLMEQLIVDTCQQQGGRVTNDSDVTNLKELVQYRACLDETPAYLGGKDNTWRELDLKILPRHHVMHDVSLYVTRGVVTANLKYSFPKYWPHSPCQKVKQIRSLMNIRYKEQIISTEKSRARSSRRSAVQRAKMMRELYLDGERKQITTPEEGYSERNQLTTSPDSEIDIMQDPEGWNDDDDDDDDDDEALSLYEWTQTLPVDVADL
ncbi:hypothetical protein LOD99_12572 [Oopsacas minuta]|uniref:Uncharacterized protein n=1 Tax=Oopsacas minuta TaxID=111878 RepID=A0AAV7JCI5_9METZ|nr:hypothetical protein LOD99_12572 [Oopsacas minuta]